MPFSSSLFVHAFLPAFLALYWLTPRSYKNYTAIFASLVFYGWGAPRFLPVVLALGVIDYTLSHQIHRRAPGRLRGWLLGLGVAMHLSVLSTSSTRTSSSARSIDCSTTSGSRR